MLAVSLFLSLALILSGIHSSDRTMINKLVVFVIVLRHLSHAPSLKSIDVPLVARHRGTRIPRVKEQKKEQRERRKSEIPIPTLLFCVDVYRARNAMDVVVVLFGYS